MEEAMNLGLYPAWNGLFGEKGAFVDRYFAHHGIYR